MYKVTVMVKKYETLKDVIEHDEDDIVSWQFFTPSPPGDHIGDIFRQEMKMAAEKLIDWIDPINEIIKYVGGC